MGVIVCAKCAKVIQVDGRGLDGKISLGICGDCEEKPLSRNVSEKKEKPDDEKSR